MKNQASKYTMRVNNNVVGVTGTKFQEIISLELCQKLVNDWNHDTYFILKNEDNYLLKVGSDVCKISEGSALRVLEHLRIKSLSFSESKKLYQSRN